MSFCPDARSRLREANPIRAEDAPSPDSPQAQALAARIMSTPVEPERKPRRRNARPTTLKVLVPVVAIAALAATVRPSHSITDPLSITCFQGPSLHSNGVSLPVGAQDPVAACKAEWEPNHTFHTTSGAVPTSLMPCLLGGGLAIFPSDRGDVCDELHLDHPDKDTSPDARREGAVEEAVGARFGAVCMQAADAVPFVEQVLEANHLSGWHVTVNGEFSGDRPCASAAYIPYQKLVILVPVRYVAPPSPSVGSVPSP